ncbi:MAG: HupE/UreJ family protein, partial [Pseudomonadota bacterium]
MYRFAIVVLCGLFATGARAHDPRPLFIDVDARALPLVTLSSKIPSSVAAAARPEISLTADCVPAGRVVATRKSDGWASVARFRCDVGLGDAGVTIRYPAANPSLSTLVRVRDANGSRQRLAAPAATRIAIGSGAAAPPPAAGFLQLGIRHIAGGLDHLLFLACLLAIAGGWRRVVLAATGFTAGHSVTLALAALGVVAVPVVYVEAMIALSVVFLAAEIVRDDRATVSFRYPASVAAAFGLLHGFGFASALTA